MNLPEDTRIQNAEHASDRDRLVAPLEAEIARLEARIALPLAREPLYDGEEIGRGTIQPHEREIVHGELRGLRYAVSVVGGVAYELEAARRLAVDLAEIERWRSDGNLEELAGHPSDLCVCGGTRSHHTPAGFGLSLEYTSAAALEARFGGAEPEDEARILLELERRDRAERCAR